MAIVDLYCPSEGPKRLVKCFEIFGVPIEMYLWVLLFSAILGLLFGFLSYSIYWSISRPKFNLKIPLIIAAIITGISFIALSGYFIYHFSNIIY